MYDVPQQPRICFFRPEARTHTYLGASTVQTGKYKHMWGWGARVLEMGIGVLSTHRVQIIDNIANVQWQLV